MTSLAQQFGERAGYTPNELPVHLARQLILDAITPICGIERIPLRDALGRILAQPVVSPIDVPAYDNSAMDGYAVRHADLATDRDTPLRIVGTAFAGRPATATVGPGEAVRIMTGAPVPAGADTIVMQEAVRATPDQVSVPPGQRAGQNLRCAGEDLRAGLPALAAGRLIRPAELGLVASLGIGELAVRRRLRVAFFSTGDEIVSIGQPTAPGQIYDSNRYTLFGVLQRLGFDVIDIGVVRDDPDTLETTVREAAGIADAILTSGGVSVGEADFTRDVMARLGDVLFWKLAMKPGRPFAFGRIGGHDGAWLFGLPGNPVATMIAFYQFARPALLRLAGVDPVAPPPLLDARSSGAIRKAPGRTEFLRGVLFEADGHWQVRSTGAQGSGILSSMADANCLIVLGPERGNVQPGDSVPVQILDGLV